MTKYTEKFKDPRWQRKRLEVLQAKNWCCEICFDTKTTLHVHHKDYIAGVEPWDYSYGYYAVLCEKCHDYEHKNMKPIVDDLVKSIKLNFFSDQITIIKTGLSCILEISDVTVSALCWVMANGEKMRQLERHYLSHLKRDNPQKYLKVKKCLE